jgi:hypothetical protein
MDTLENKAVRQPTIADLLRLNTSLDIIFNASLFRAHADVRSAIVLDITPKTAIVAQPCPPIVRSKIGADFEASLVSCNAVTCDFTRWGWESRILDILSDYVPREYPDTPPAQAVVIALPPPPGKLRPTNIRLHYRLDVTEDDEIQVRTVPPVEREPSLLNFSAGGAMLSVPGKPQVQHGKKMHVHLIFPWPDENSKTHIKSKAEVVRVNYAKGGAATQLGLKFQNMDMECNRTLGKIINHYMLAEQRQRTTCSL